MRLLAFFPGFFLVSLPFFAFNQVSFAQGQTVFFEDFETGDPLPEGWTVTGNPEILWHIAEDGECLAQTQMGAYNLGPGACDYNTGGTSFGRLKSPPFFLTGDPPYTLSFQFIRQVDSGGDNTCATIEDVNSPASEGLGCPTDNSGTLQSAEVQIPNSPAWAGREVTIEFQFIANQFGNNNPGWFVDNVEVRNSTEPPVPTVSEWGLIILTLLLLTSGTLVHRHRRSVAA
ncbi:MAG: IPTL-CTERM sorting domain-containing protein [Phycisphaerae bacterium]